MDKIIDLHLSFMEQLVEEGIVLHVLERVGISILSGFTDQSELVQSYSQIFYFKPGQRIVLCGINELTWKVL
ncbi:hypothetical protein [Sporosarcina sp. D27]|uniref:hypothetical protein n=1 Tax=Sporosarcina sp. D27 TaxID=1382305 RepID=UPI0004714F0D|nr:hypothetical protein [Sporosarcina sp. D27]